jgi:hypothetical protein
MIREEIRSITSTRRDLRNFGLVVGTGFALIAAFLFWKGSPAWPWLGGGAAALILLGLAAPPVLKPLQKAWMAMAVVMGWFMTRLILSVLFFFVMTTIGLVGRLAGKKFLPVPEGDSYWIRRTPGDAPSKRLDKQF